MAERLFLRLEGDPLYTPETSVPAGTMTELAVHPALADHVAHVTIYREDIIAPTRERVIPDGVVRLMFDLAGRGAAIAGASATPVVLALSGRQAGLTVTLRPGAAGELLGIAADELRDRCVPLDAWDASFDLDQLHAADDDRARGALVQAMLYARLGARRQSERRRVQTAMRVLARGTVREAAATVGVGERRLQQLFEREVGLAPRAFRRLARVHACLRTLRTRRAPRWSQLALEHGFYDQAHLANELRAVTGLTPTELAARVSGTSKTPRRASVRSRDADEPES